MLKEVINKQKEEKERFLASCYIERTKDIIGQKWLDSDLIKVVLGPRRAGKSVFSFMLLKDHPFMYFNFDEEILTEGGISTDELIKELHSVYGKIKNIFFDEIQNLPSWELFVNRLHREGYNLLLTGSNAHLLSKELATSLTGRHIPIEILPFDFKEFLRAKNFKMDSASTLLPPQRGELLRLADNYLHNGGFPEVTVKNLDAKAYLDVLFDSLLFKDVVKRHKVKFATQIDSLGSYLMDNFASLYSLRKLQNVLNLKSVTTTEKYVGYLEEAYLILSLSCYSPQSGYRIKTPRKIYAVDNGFIKAKAVQHSPDSGKLMENLVFMELVKRGYEPNRSLFYYKTRNSREVDFALKSGAAICELVQVSYEIGDYDTEQREIKALTEAAGELGVEKMTILTWDQKKEVKKDSLTVHFVPLWEWLLGMDV